MDEELLLQVAGYRPGNNRASLKKGGLDYLTVSGTECCGWLLVSGYGLSPAAILKTKKDLLMLSTDKIFWAGVGGDDDEVFNMPLLTVIAGYQIPEYEEYLLELGWIAMTPFNNPNTGNICKPFMFLPTSCKVE